MSTSTPPPERSLNRQVVLDEDEYTAALSHIIARDFFPSLVHLDATNGYLDALQTKDPQLIGQSVRRLEELNSTPATLYRGRTPGQTPYGAVGDTPLRTPRGEPPTKRARYDTDMSLDHFQTRYTSEDNSSFTQILDEENRTRKERWAWAFDAQKRVEAQRERMIEGREKMLIEAPGVTGVREKFVIEAPTSAGLLTDGREVESSEGDKSRGKGVEPKGEAATTEDEGSGKELVKSTKPASEDEVVDVMARKKDTRAAGVDGWRFRARNSLMFPPDADESPYHPTISSAPEKDPKVITHNNTRLPEQEESSSVSRAQSAPPSPTRSRIGAAIAGTPYRPKSPPGSFSLVPNLPSPTPSELGPGAVKQLMTWGTLMGTPRVISSEDEAITPSTPFRIAPPSSREALSHRLSNDAAKSLRVKAELLNGARTPRASGALAGKKGSMAPPSWTPRRTPTAAAGSLTPAAKRLLDRTAMGTAASRRAEAMNRMSGWDSKAQEKSTDLGKVRWTPTPGTSSSARK
ncbi:hypothetical protein HGRIS_007780 [Hohenbuehelia grisea]|uniref:Uncharacterized protein n=1 Tax=Hohenbuehelia grisea TaxID=104357 RepID=A0ABR3J7A5_9AGAR